MQSSEEALKKLLEGNKRFAQNKSIHPNLGSEFRNSLVNGQKPFAAVLACSDSRAPVEIIFDVGLGDIFVIRSAGHVLSNEALGSLEYAVSELGVNLVIILGHDNCGAINAALTTYNSEQNLSESMQALLNHIYPALKGINTHNNDNLINEAVKANINYQFNDLIKRDFLLAKKIKDKTLFVYPAIYKLDTGLVEVLK